MAGPRGPRSRNGQAGGAVQSVERTFDLIEALAGARRPMGISELGQATSLPYATVHRLLGTLVNRGYVRHDVASRKYALGSRMLKLGDAAGGVFRNWVTPYLAEVVDISGETTNVSTLEDGHVVYVAQAPSRHLVRMFTEVGNRVLPHTSASGKVLLANGPRAEALEVIERHGLPARTPFTITNAEHFLEELERVRKQGWATDGQEEELGVRCVAVPLYGVGDSVMAMSVSGPAERLDESRQDDVLPAMQRVAKAIARDWAHTGHA